MDFVKLGEDIDKDNYLIADFYIETDDILKNAGELAKESSNGTWTQLKTAKGYASSLSAFVFYAKELFEMSDIDGGLVGGASLKADEFAKIVEYK